MRLSSNQKLTRCRNKAAGHLQVGTCGSDSTCLVRISPRIGAHCQFVYGPGKQLEARLSPFGSSMGMSVDVAMDTGSVTVDQNARAGAGVGPGPAFSAQKTNGTRLRTSCDACQNLKVKCSQDKPSCRRCSKNRLDCVYSPLRRMGRPKKSSAVPPAASSITSSPSPITSVTPRSKSQLHDSQRRRHATTATPSPACLMQPQLIGHTPAGTENMSRAEASFGLENSDIASDGMYNGDMVLGAKDGTLRGPYPAALLQDRPETTTSANYRFFTISAGLNVPSASAQQRPRLLTSPLTTLVSLESQVGTHQGSSASDGDQLRIQAGHCYLAILQRLTQLEATLDASAQPPRLDVILSAERDTRALKERIFSCQGHERRELDMVGRPTAANQRSPQSCIDAHGLSLLVLGLLADRVTRLFEDLFRRAAVNSHWMDQATRVTTAAWLYGSQPVFASQADERQYERSSRSSFSRNIHCPVPEANCELTIGNYEVDDEVKSRVMKLILKNRVRAIEEMLGDLGNYLRSIAGQGDSPGSEGNGQGPAGEQGSILLGSVDRSRGSRYTATAYMVEDLHRRAEMLRGRLELAGH